MHFIRPSRTPPPPPPPPLALLLGFLFSRTDAYLWRLPSPLDTMLVDTTHGPGDAVGIPNLVNPMVDDDGGGGTTEGGGRYQYVGGLPDLQSSEVTTLSVREPLLATGLADGRIFLWR